VNIWLANKTTHMESSPSWEAGSRQEIPLLLRNTKVHVHRSVHKSPPLGQMNTVHIFTAYFLNICFNILIIFPTKRRWSSKWSFRLKFCERFSYLTCVPRVLLLCPRWFISKFTNIFFFFPSFLSFPSALQLRVSFGLLNNQPPFLPVLHLFRR
jgi:hypothetical protein